jgi:secreted trypsin-like serine protease
MRRSLVVLGCGALVTLITACSSGSNGSEHANKEGEPIIGGTLATGDPAVGYLSASDPTLGYGWGCTGTLVKDNIFVSAGHCVEDATASTTFKIYFGSDIANATAADWHAVSGFHAHPKYGSAGWDIGQGYDCSVLTLSQPVAGVTPIPYSHTAVDSTFDGSTVRVVGYGVSNGVAQTGSGTKRELTTTIVSHEGGVINVGSSGHTSCQGDSGGPTFKKFGGVEQIIGITSFGEQNCPTYGSMTRVDMCAAWIDTFTQVACTPSCGGKQCGSDGCGGTCGTCASGTTCNAASQCEANPTCTPQCSGKECGADGCGGSCGSCSGNGATCNASGKCQTPVTGSCANGGWESGNNKSAATADALCPDGTIKGHFLDGSESDWYTFSVAPNHTYTIDITDLGPSYGMALYKDAGTGAANATFITVNDSTGPGTKRISRTTSTGGTYYVWAYPLNGASTTTPYTLSVSVQ